MSEKMDIEKKKCLTPEFRVSFPAVFEPKSYEGGPEKYSVVMLYDKSTDLKELKRAAINAATEKYGSDQKKWPKCSSGEKFKMPFRDGDQKTDLQGYEGTIFVTATSKQRPGVVDQRRAPITEQDDQFYAGCYARATLIAFTYDKAGNRGVSFSLQNLQKLKDGERFSGRRNAEDEFSDVEEIDSGEDSETENADLGF